MIVLPDGQAVFLQIPNPGQRSIRSRSKKKPSDMGVKESFGDVVRIIFMIGKLVVPAVIGAPAQSGSFKSSGTKQEREQLHRPPRLEGKMGKQTVVTQRNAYTRRRSQNQEEDNLKDVQPIVPDVSRDTDNCGEKRSDEKRAIPPINFFPGQIHE